MLAQPLDETLLGDAFCFSAVQSMYIRNGFTTTVFGLKSIFTKCTNLRYLNVSNPGRCIEDELIKTVGMYCDNINDLTLWCAQSKISKDGFRFLAQRLQLLRKLSLGSLDGAGNESTLLIFCEYCTTLEILSLSCCGSLSDVALDAIAQGCPHLKELRFGGDNGTFSSAALCQMLQGLPQLTTISFPFCTSSILEPVCIVRLSQCCPNLLCLETGSIDVDDEAICALARNCSCLEELAVYGAFLTDASVSVLANLCPLVRKLSFGGCAFLTDVSLFTIAKSCPHLFFFRTNNCTKITDAGYIAIAQHCPQLTYIALSCGATDATIKQLALHSSRLSCVWCHSSSCFSDSALIALVKGCKELALVDMKDCRGLTTEGVAIAQSFNVDIRIYN